MAESPFFIPADDRPDLIARMLTPDAVAPSLSGCGESSGKEGKDGGKDGKETKDVDMMLPGLPGAVPRHPLT